MDRLKRTEPEQNNRMKTRRGQWFVIDIKYMVPPFGNHFSVAASGRSVIRTAIENSLTFIAYSNRSRLPAAHWLAPKSRWINAWLLLIHHTYCSVMCGKSTEFPMGYSRLACASMSSIWPLSASFSKMFRYSLFVCLNEFKPLLYLQWFVLPRTSKTPCQIKTDQS